MCSRTQQTFKEEARKFLSISYFKPAIPVIKESSDHLTDNREVIELKLRHLLSPFFLFITISC